MGNNILNILPYMMLGIMLVTSCTKPYLPPAIKAVTGYLVVEGVINPGNDTTKIQLSRTVNLSSDSNSAPVTGAQVTIQGNDNSSYVLTDNGTGLYTEAPVTLSYAKQYRLDIKTPDGQEYQSDYVTPKATPPIDTINFAPKTLGQVSSLQISLNTHDPSNNTLKWRHSFIQAGKHAKLLLLFNRPVQ
jgi:hypothetical protein